eukprot:CAMPEP_0181247098 /NCGR_PEP_ID=MMETSP1096-20121128/44410_1 /TAXON_ID=156174 ORGANISM="Chrysochromulina ericina, Strain CCMP281" /NCGR_SAMPLE_ID=MMETSP1096 /ASSEMBLY_ACC=CAM_ASM_000453 /LENGTH=51 /DNA_ID=CAMNT_0023344087 /DNA_START=45 /DNA_END=196 /DNA_ORIENTATION=-
MSRETAWSSAGRGEGKDVSERIPVAAAHIALIVVKLRRDESARVPTEVDRS